MLQTTPVQDRSTRFSCPNPPCAWGNQPGKGTITHRSWTGAPKRIERLRCTAGDRDCSKREGTLMACSTLPEATVARLLPCQRWGVGDEGTADSCAGDLTTVQRLQSLAAHRAQTQQQQGVQQGDVPGVQCDEAPATLRPRPVEGSHTALAMGSWFVLWVDCGPHPQEHAATLMAQVIARVREVPVVLTDGWKPIVSGSNFA